jgi:hypothetical protein
LVIDEDLRATPAVDDGRAGLHVEADRIVAGGEAYGHCVDRAIITAVEGCQVDVDLFDAGATQVADGDVVGAALRYDIHRFHTVQVHCNAPDIAREQRV